jgi:hypothetical protein
MVRNETRHHKRRQLVKLSAGEKARNEEKSGKGEGAERNKAL